jgi:alkylated DNA repair protein (DNA oxidative demethylase)
MDLTLPSARSRMRSSRLGGVPATLPPLDAAPYGQLHLPLEAGPGTASREPQLSRPLPGVAVLHGWLPADEQRALVEEFRQWALPPAGLRHPRVPAGHAMSIQSVCLGWHWQPYRYSRTADDTDGAPVKPMPPALAALARRAVAATDPIDSDLPGDAAAFAPDAAIVNRYPPGAKLGLHQDGEEPATAPVVTISLGDTCTFRLAGVDRRTRPFTDLTLASGDVLVFGGRNRRVFHGVPNVAEGTAPSWLPLPPGRLSITVRETGLA